MDSATKLSVIIPVYNVGPYLRQCIDSVIGQTLSEIEIILIDDGSLDESGRICDEYAATDQRIKVIHKKNQGLACARNDGIDASTAPYVMFVDGDDWVEPDFCRRPYEEAVENDADMVLFTFSRICNNGRALNTDTKAAAGLLSEADAIRFNVCIWDAAWVGLYRRDLFNQVRYPDGRYYEDTGTSHRLIHEAKRIVLINESLYNYRVQRPGSIITDPKTREHPDRRAMWESRVADLRSWGYEEYAQLDAFRMLVRYGWRKQEQKVFVDVVDEMSGQIPSCFSRKQSMMLQIYRISPILFDGICILMRKRQKPYPLSEN